jgi:hypothetical protein
MKIQVMWIFSLLFVSSLDVQAQDDTFLPSAAPVAQPAKKGNSRPEVLDFEGDVIEGQKKAPELFLQLDVEKADLSSVLYDRRDFNDFHAVDSKRRPKFSDPKAKR